MLFRSLKISGIILILITLLDLFDVASKDNLYIINIDKKVFSYSKQEKLKLNAKSIISMVIRIFFSSLTSIPHVVLLLYPLFFYFTKIFSLYVFLYLIVTLIKIFTRSRNIFINYKKNELH